MVGVELRELRFVVALADELNFTRAAARCHISQQALSRAIALLERRLGTPVVERRPRGCALTPAGARLASAARPLLAEADALRAGLAECEPAPAGLLRVGLMLDGLGAATAPLLAAFRATHPAIRILVQRLHADRVVDALLDRSVDVALLHGPVEDDRIEILELYTEPRIAAVSAGSPLADAGVLAAADLLVRPARARRPRVREEWEGFFTLVSERNGEQPDRFGEPTANLEELLYSIGLDDLFLTMPAHLAGTYPGHLFGVRYLPVPDLAPVPFGMAHLSPVTPLVTAFHAAAHHTITTRALAARHVLADQNVVQGVRARGS
jgi:DNA-binding transcriptional LysR family regulator